MFNLLLRWFLPVSAVLLSSCSSPESAKQKYLDKGNDFFEQGQYADAVLNYKKAIQNDSKDAELFYRLGLANLKSNETRAAYQAFNTALSLAPARTDIKVAVADLALAGYLADPQKPAYLYDRVEGIAKDLLKAGPDSYDGLRLSAYLRLADRKPEAALPLLERANGLKPRQPDITIAIVQTLGELGRSNEAEQKATAFLQQRPDVPELYDVLYVQYRNAHLDDKAEQILKQKIARLPNDARAPLQLCRHYFNQGRQPEMKACIDKFVDAPKRFPGVYAAVAEFYSSIGDREAAIAYLEQGIGNSNEVESRRMLPTLLVERGRPADANRALGLLTTLVRESPEDSSLQYDLARAHLLNGAVDQAMTELNGVVQKQPVWAPPRLTLARIYQTRNNHREALRHATEAEKIEPQNVQAQVLAAGSLLALGELETAKTKLGPLLRANPDNSEVQLQYALVQLGLGNITEAESLLSKLYAPGSPDRRPLLGLVEALLRRKQPDRAIELASREMKTASDPKAARILLASTAVRAGRYELASQVYRELLSQEPQSTELHVRLGEVQQLKGDFAGAGASFQKAIELDPKANYPSTALAALRYAAGKPEEAKALYRKILQAEPANPIALNNLAFLLTEEASDLTEAEQLASKAVSLAPKNLDFKDTLGWIYYKRKQYDGALETFDSLTKRAPENATYRYHLGAALLAKGRQQQALTELQTALRKSATPDEKAKIRELLASVR